jgi:hypothetical protein
MAQRQPDRAVEEQVLLQANQPQEQVGQAVAVTVEKVLPDQLQQLTQAQVAVEVVGNLALLTLAGVMVVLE